jgi:ABC-type phosphate/phosphonate transport system substrate-binding protein
MNAAPDLVAALPMYDLPELQEANDALWSSLRTRLVAQGVPAPAALNRDLPLGALWRHPGLLLAQTCGYPLGKHLHDKVRLIATPRYAAFGCDGPFHRSAIVVRAGDKAESLLDTKGRRCAVNALDSNTGMNLLRAEIAPLARGGAFFASVSVTGAHLASATAVAEGEADLAAIDCVTWAHLRRHRSSVTKSLRVLAWTMRTPGLPLIAAPDLSRTVYRALASGLDEIVLDPALREARRTLLLDGINVLPLTHYRAANFLEEMAERQGYPVLA